MLNFTLTLPEDVRSEEHWTTREFRQSRRDARRSFIISAFSLCVGLAAFLVNMTFGQNLTPAVGMVAITTLSVVTVFFVVVSRHPPVILRVGPEGFQHALLMKRPASWLEVKAITSTKPRKGWLRRVQWLNLRFAPNASNDIFYPWARGPVRWLIGAFGVRIALHSLRGTREDVIGSIERYKPVHSG